MMLSQRIKNYTQKTYAPSKKSKPKNKSKKKKKDPKIDEDYPPPRSKSHKKKKTPKKVQNKKHSKEIYSESSSQSSSSSSSSSESQGQTYYSGRRRKGLPADYQPQEVLIEKPQINDPRLNVAMENILLELIKDVKPKSSHKKYSQQQRLILRQSLTNIFPEDAFPYRQELTYKPLNHRYVVSPNQPPRLKYATNPMVSATQFTFSSQQLPLRGFEYEDQGNVDVEEVVASDVVMQTKQKEALKSKKDREMSMIQKMSQQQYQQKQPQRQQPQLQTQTQAEVLFNKQDVHKYLSSLPC